MFFYLERVRKGNKENKTKQVPMIRMRNKKKKSRVLKIVYPLG